MSPSDETPMMTARVGCHPSFRRQQKGRKHSLLFSLFTTVLLCGQSQVSLAIDINGFTISGDERAGWVQYDYSNPKGKPEINKGHKDSHGFYVMPKLSIETPSYNNFRAKITGAAATDFGLNDHDKQSRNFVFDPSENESFAILQELYLEYENDQHHALIGRNEIFTPMIEHDDYYMLSNSFEVAAYTYKSRYNTNLHAGYFHKMAGVWDSGDNGTEFHSMSDASFVPQVNKNEADDSGVYYGAMDFSNGRHHAQLWEYYAEDLYNNKRYLVHYVIATGVDENSVPLVQLYPNPVKDHLYVNLGSLSEKTGVLEVYDLSGKMLINLETQAGYQIFNLDVQQLTTGMYLIRRFEEGELLGVGKFIKTE